jgi:adenine deaminase
MGPLGKCAETHGTQSLVENEVKIQVVSSPKKLQWVLRGGRRAPKMFARQSNKCPICVELEEDGGEWHLCS